MAANFPGQPPRADLAHLRALLRFVTPYSAQLALALFALLVAAACVLALGQGLRYVIDSGFASRDPRLLNQALAGVVGIAAVLAGATYVRYAMMMSVGERAVADLRRAIFDHVLGLSPEFYDAARTGDVISRLTSDTEQLRQVLAFGFSMFLRNLLMVAGAAALLVVTSPRLAALILLGVPLVLAPVLIIGRRERRLARHNQDCAAAVAAYIDEAIHEIRTVQASVHEEADRVAFAGVVGALCRAGVARIRTRAFMISLVMLFAFCGVGFILWIGGHGVIQGQLSAGDLSAFVFYAAVVASGTGVIAEIWGEIQRAAGATERVSDLLAMRPLVSAPARPLALPARLPGGIRFESIVFAYPTRPDSPALAGFTLAVSPGETVALVGPSGAGKSTVLALLLRFYDPQSGRILLDGFDIAACHPREVRRHIALVPQEPVIFAANVIENVRYARPGASLAEVRAACEAAHALEFVERLPRGFETELGERGVQLSGGQRQRISIARALLADREFLLLDEATSSLDAESERQVNEALAALARGRTTLVIAHRLATVQRANRIVVLDQGEVHATGTHAQLMRAGGLYAHLARLQFLHDASASA